MGFLLKNNRGSLLRNTMLKYNVLQCLDIQCFHELIIVHVLSNISILFVVFSIHP